MGEGCSAYIKVFKKKKVPINKIKIVPSHPVPKMLLMVSAWENDALNLDCPRGNLTVKKTGDLFILVASSKQI